MTSKNQKLLKGQRGVVQGEDRISKLSDALLHHILSFLPIKCAICTTILSTRWRYVWNSVPNLDFRHWRSPTSIDIRLETKRFMNFMDRMLILRDMSSIQKFYLICDEHCDESRVNAWISAVIRRNIEELILFMDVKEPFMIPLSLFTCESLTTLELDTGSDLNLPKSVYLPRLKILRLTLIKFTNIYSTEQLFSNCPLLEELNILSCAWMGILCISAPALKCLIISDFNGEIKINAPSLVSFEYSGSVAKGYVISSFSSLVDADIRFLKEVGWKMRKQEIGYGATKLVGQLSNVKRLIVSGATLEALSFADDLFTNLPTFYNLIHLEVRSKFLYSTGEALLDLLQIFPKLESLVFYGGVDPCLSYDNDGWTQNMVPQGLMSHLKSVEFGQFTGHTRELNIVKLVLKNAEVLQRMTIYTPPLLYLENKLQYLENKLRVTGRLLMLPRGSPSCVIQVI